MNTIGKDMEGVKKAYIIWHTDRTGSNTICNLLAQTGVLGIVDFWTCGFHLGHGDQIKPHYPESLYTYVGQHTTPNGVFGAKAGITYQDQLNKYLGASGIFEVYGFITHHIVLARRNKVRQAISQLFAGTTKRYHSETENYRDVEVPYNRHKIDWAIQHIVGEHARIDTFLGLQGFEPLRLYYEDYIQDFDDTIDKIARFLDVPYTSKGANPLFKKLDNPKKEEFYKRYMAHE